MLPANLLLQNRYRIIRLIGQGGMGAVYEAADERLGHTVALKQIVRGDEQAFAREARLLARLRHPALPKVSDHFVDEAGHFLVMEFMAGDDLSTVLARRGHPFPLTTVLTWADQLLTVLDHLHRLDPPIIHRDIKPANLKVNQDNQLILLDFGLAKGHTDLTSEPQKSAAGYTLAYAAPEQIRGTGTDARGDLYAVGATLYHLVTGARPPDAIQRALLLADGKPDPVRQQANTSDALPATFLAVLAQALSLAPEKRFATAQAFWAALQASIEQTTPPVTLPSVMPLSPPLPATPHNLPAQLTPLLGRETALAALQTLVRQPTVRLVTLTGPGGVGKTRLSRAVGWQLLTNFMDGVFEIKLADVRDPQLVMSALAQTLGVREAGGQPLQQCLTEHLHAKETLLLIDNFEQVIDAAPRLSELLMACPQMKLLVTSRETLRLSGEQEFPVSTLAPADAVALFVQRTQAVKPTFLLDATQAPIVAAICRQLDCLPLAIELAAARSKLLTPAGILDRLQDRLKFLRGGARDLPDRQQTLEATIEWSYQLLSAEEQALCRRLAVFTGGCNLNAVENICNPAADELLKPLSIDLLDGLTSLADKSLLNPVEGSNDEPRFTMLVTIYQYMRNRLLESSEYSIINDRHTLYYLELAETAQTYLDKSNQATWFNRLEVDHNNLRSALSWSQQKADKVVELRLSAALWPFWQMRGYHHEARRWLESALTASDHTPAIIRANALSAAANVAADQGDFKTASSKYEEALALYHVVEDKSGIARSLTSLGIIARIQANYHQARTLLEESLTIFKELNDTHGVASALLFLGRTIRLQGDTTLACTFYMESLSAFENLGDRQSTAAVAVALGNLQADLGNHALARNYWERAIVIVQETGDQLGFASIRFNQAMTVMQEGNYGQAQLWYEEALALQRKLGHQSGVANSLLYLGLLSLLQENYAQARLLLVQGLEMERILGQKQSIARSLEAFAELALLEQEPERAAQLLGAAESLRLRINAPIPPRDRNKYNQLVLALHDCLTEEKLRSARTAGQTMSLEQAITYALASF